MIQMFHTLPRELLNLITAYIDYRNYLSLARTNKKMYNVLAAESSLRRYLREDDTHLNPTHLMEGLQHMAEHMYLFCETVVPAVPSSTRKKITPIKDHHDIILNYKYSPFARRDIFYRFLEDASSQEYLYDIQSAFYCEHLEKNVLLYRDGSINCNDKIHPVQAVELLDIFDSGIFYRNHEGYCILSYDGATQVREDIPEPTSIKMLCYIYDIAPGETKEEDIEFISIEYLLTRNGDLYCQSLQGENEVRFIPQLAAQNIKKILIWCNNRYWVLTETGKLHCVDLDYTINYICPVNDITDIATGDNYNMYILVDGRSIFLLNKKDGVPDITKLYTLDVTCDALSVFELDEDAGQVMLQLKIR